MALGRRHSEVGSTSKYFSHSCQSRVVEMSRRNNGSFPNKSLVFVCQNIFFSTFSDNVLLSRWVSVSEDGEREEKKF